MCKCNENQVVKANFDTHKNVVSRTDEATLYYIKYMHKYKSLVLDQNSGDPTEITTTSEVAIHIATFTATNHLKSIVLSWIAIIITIFIPLATQGAYQRHFGWALIKTLIYI